MGVAMHAFPLVGAALQAGDACANLIVENFRATSGNRVKASVAQTGDGVLHTEAADVGNAQNLRRRKTVQMQTREALFDRTEQIFVIRKRQLGIEAALHENARPAESDSFLDLPGDGLEGQDVAVFCAHRAIKSAERAVLGAEIRVIDVAVDLISRYAR